MQVNLAFNDVVTVEDTVEVLVEIIVLDTVEVTDLLLEEEAVVVILLDAVLPRFTLPVVDLELVNVLLAVEL